jgi:feruloyl esterase
LASTTIPAALVGQPSSGANITAAVLKAADAATGAAEYCQVNGDIVAVNPADPVIKFQVNLPTTWNIKTMQLGGGGMNGSIPALVRNESQPAE